MSQNLTWVAGESIGVPFLFCSVAIALDWEGCHKPANGRIVEALFRANGPESSATDYDRACDAADDYYSSLRIGAGTALVLGEENPAATWLAAEQFAGGYVLIWVMLPAEDPDYRSIVGALPPSFFDATGITLCCSDDGFLLFPATQSPHDEYFQSVKAACPAGAYSVSFGIYRQTNTAGEPETEIRILEVRKQL